MLPHEYWGKQEDAAMTPEEKKLREIDRRLRAIQRQLQKLIAKAAPRKK